VRQIVKKIIPLAIKRVILQGVRLFSYTQYDSSSYWKKRASNNGQSAVLWKNEEYNKLYRKKQSQIIKPYIIKLKLNDNVLDIGCGIGVVSNMMTKINQNIDIDAVDFKEMIEVAKKKYPNTQVTYISSSAEAYYDELKKYSLIISSGCFSAIRDIETMKKAIANSAKMCKRNGTILMIDPFHRWNYLARVKFNSKEVEQYMNKLGFKLIEKSGVIFWPYREKFANSKLIGSELESEFEKGEKLLKRFGIHFWADYKILVFKKTDD